MRPAARRPPGSPSGGLRLSTRSASTPPSGARTMAGSELQGQHGAQLEWRAAQQQDEPRLADRLHPGADQADDLPRPVETVVPMAQGGQASPECGRRRGHGADLRAAPHRRPQASAEAAGCHRVGECRRAQTLLAMLTNGRAACHPPIGPKGIGLPLWATIGPTDDDQTDTARRRLVTGPGGGPAAQPRTDAAHHGARGRGALRAAAARHRPAHRSIERRRRASMGDPIDRLPRVVALPPGGDTGSGTAQPAGAHPAQGPSGGRSAGRHPSGPRGLRPRCAGDRRLGARHLGWTGASGWPRDGLARLDGSRRSP